MLTVVLVALGLLAGLPPVLLALIGLAVWQPLWFLIGVAGWVLVKRRRQPVPAEEEAVFLRRLAAELSGGSTVREAVDASAGSCTSLELQRARRYCDVGLPLAEIGRALEEALPVNGSQASSALSIAGRTGAPLVVVVESLADRAEQHAAIRRESRAATAQARMSAWLVGGIPAGFGLMSLLGGWGPGAGGADGPAKLIVGIGLALIGLGSLVVWGMLRTARG